MRWHIQPGVVASVEPARLQAPCPSATYLDWGLVAGAVTDVAIETKDLGKSFGQTRALDGVSLRIAAGTVFGLLGPNGAGKTTAIRVLATLLRPSDGSARVMGHDVVHQAKQVRKRIGLTGQFASIDEELSGSENLVLVGRLLGLKKVDARQRAAQLLGAFGLADAGARLVGTYSGGMRRRLDIAASLVRTPDVLFLDEPTSGLDPRSRNEVWTLVRKIAADGTTVLLTTQHLDEADRLADRLAVIDHGRVIAEGTAAELKASVGANSLHVRVANRSNVAAARKVLESTFKAPVTSGSDAAELSVAVGESVNVTRALAGLDSAGVALASFSLGTPSLDEVFFALTGKPVVDASGEDPR